MDQDYRGGVAGEDFLRHFARMHVSALESAAKQLHEFDEPVA